MPAGLELVYLGVESGDDVILKNVCKGATSDEIVAAGEKLRDYGIKDSVTLIYGLGGRELHTESPANQCGAFCRFR